MILKNRFLWNLFLFVLGATILIIPAVSTADDPPEVFSLADTIKMAIDANLNLKQSQEEVRAAQENRKASITQFFPTLSSTYDYVHRNREQTQQLTGIGPGPDFVVRPDDEYTFVTSFNQPIFRGFSLINQYRIADMGLDAAEFSERITRQDVILDAKNAFFSVLKALKLLDVAKQRVTQIAAQKEVAENFYEVGMSPLNDLLESQATLANARQDLIVALNDLAIAKSQFNTLLRRRVNAPVELQDVLDYTPFVHDFEYCLNTATNNRLEITVADLDVEIAEKEVDLARKDYMPSVNLRGEYIRSGDDWEVSGGEGISDARNWNIRATAEWDFWEWGRTH
ncbi:MAG: TolC family protein, partial [Desulfobacterales bacterium]